LTVAPNILPNGSVPNVLKKFDLKDQKIGDYAKQTHSLT